MSQVPQGPEGQAQATAPPVAPDALAPTPAPPAPAAPQDQQAFIQVPRGVLPGDDWHQAKAQLNTLEQARREGLFDLASELSAAGWSVEGIRELLRQPPEPLESPPGAPAPGPYLAQQQQQPAAPPPEDDKPMTVKQYQELQAKQRQEAADAEREKQIEDARKAQEEFVHRTLSEAKIKPPEQGQRSPKFNAARALLVDAILDQKWARIPSWVSDKEQQQQFLDAPLTEAEQEASLDQFKADMADLANENVASFAEQQSQEAAASLGEGPGGRQPPQAGEMSPQQEFEHVTDHIQDTPP